MIGPAKKAQFGRVADALGCAVTGSMSARRHSGETLVLDSTKVDEISVGGRVVRAVTAGIADIRRMLPPGAPPVIGALSAVFLSRHPATFDLERDRIIFESRNFLSERRKGRGFEMKPRFPARGCMDLFVEVLTQNGRRGWFELDTCSTTVLLNQEIWGETGKKPSFADKDSGRTSPENAQLALWLDGAPETTMQVPVEVAKCVFDGLLGLPYLRRLTFTVDVHSLTLWVSGPG